MTPRERAGAVWDMFTLDLAMPNDNRPPVTVQRIILAIERAITAAIEDEREACADIVYKQFMAHQKGRRPASALVAAEAQIRGRGDKSDGGTK